MTSRAHGTVQVAEQDRRELLARQGLRFPGIILKQLRNVGIYCQPTISIEHQHLAKRYVLRGVESGGAIADLGALLELHRRTRTRSRLAATRGYSRCQWRACHRGGSGVGKDRDAPRSANL